jgi:hypothetical protein
MYKLWIYISIFFFHKYIGDDIFINIYDSKQDHTSLELLLFMFATIPYKNQLTWSDTEKISWRRAANDHLNTGKIHIKKNEKDTTHQPG